ncbi:MAG: hypothetical protein V4655_06915 [Bdellovibrionota bacterium]
MIALSALQAALMFVDEGYFHRRRGLGKFERYGHVADTLMFTFALSVPYFLVPNQTGLILYGVLALGSSLLITKDEWIHADTCTGLEHWCHAMLFVLHGALLLCFGLLWFYDPQALILRLLPLGTLAFAAYQHIYWNVYVRRRHQ